MNRQIKIIYVVFSAMLALGFGLGADESANGQDHIQWQYDLDKAKKMASEQDKLILLHFTASWCAPCKELERYVFVNPMAIRAISNQVIPVKVDVDLKKEIATEYNVHSVPFDIVITPAGHVVSTRKSPRSSDGYLQMFEQSKLAARHLTDEAVKEVANMQLVDKAMRERAAAAKDKVESYGSIADEQIQKFQNPAPNSTGVPVPQFENPKPWSDSNVIAGADRSTESNRTSAFQPSGQFRPAIPKTNPFRKADGPATPVIKNPHVGHSPESQPLLKQNQNPVQNQTTQSSPLAPSQATRAFPISEKSGLSPTPNLDAQANLPKLEGTRIGNNKYKAPFVVSNKTETENKSPKVVKNPMVSEQETIANKTPAALQEKRLGTVAATTPKTDGSPAKTRPLGLDGYCGVSLIDGQKWAKGDPRWGCIHRGKLYLFTSEKNREQFRMSPDMYSPLLGGADPVAFQTTGNLVEGQRKFGVFYGDEGEQSVIILFANQQNRDQFESTPAEYLKSVREATSRLDTGLKLR